MASLRALASRIAPYHKMSASGERREIVIVGTCAPHAHQSTYLYLPRTARNMRANGSFLKVVVSSDAAQLII